LATTSLPSQDGPYDAQLIEEHRLLARRIDKAAVQIDHVCSAPANQTPSEIKRLIELLEGVLEAAREHFQHEEALMTKDGFPGLVVHKRDHDSLIRALKELMSSLGQGPVRLSTDIGMNLRSWLTYHVKRYDEAYAAFAASGKPDATS
jgi:hemerythrin-like metal-binding protein